MWEVVKKLRDNARQILEIVVLIIAGSLPHWIDFRVLFKSYLENNSLSPDNWMYYLAISHGNWTASILLIILTVWGIQKFNNEFVMNEIDVYHNYCYGWYWFCAKILGVKKCDLISVPIYMQFKLVLNKVFNEFPLDEKHYPEIDNEKVKVIQKNEKEPQNEINLILEDTYVIKNSQIPYSKRNLFAIKISRNGGSNGERHYSEAFMEKIISTVKGLENTSVVNVYATTNPLHTKYIAERVFKSGGRGDIRKLYVYQQNRNGDRNFEDRGHRIY